MIGCAWIDEFTTRVQSINSNSDVKRIKDFKHWHNQFVNKRIKALKLQPPKRKAEIIECCAQPKMQNDEDQDAIERAFFHQIKQAGIDKHNHHYLIDEQSQTRVSFGVVRVANIPPCIALTRYLAETKWPDDYEI